MCMSVCIHVLTTCVSCAHRGQQTVGYPGTGVRGGCEPLRVLRSEPGSC